MSDSSAVLLSRIVLFMFNVRWNGDAVTLFFNGFFVIGFGEFGFCERYTHQDENANRSTSSDRIESGIQIYGSRLK
eukprot:scaffold314034_cov34-Attheya_sp.AAC.1